jgi:hypothetical protein
VNLERSTARLPTHDVFESVVLHLIEYVMQFRRETVLQGGRTIFAFRLSFYLLPIHLRLLTKSFGLCVYFCCLSLSGTSTTRFTKSWSCFLCLVFFASRLFISQATIVQVPATAKGTYYVTGCGTLSFKPDVLSEDQRPERETASIRTGPREKTPTCSMLAFFPYTQWEV